MRLCPLRRFRRVTRCMQCVALSGEKRHSAVTVRTKPGPASWSGLLGRGPRLLHVERDLALTGRRRLAAGSSQPFLFTRILVLSAEAHPGCGRRSPASAGRGRGMWKRANSCPTREDGPRRFRKPAICYLIATASQNIGRRIGRPIIKHAIPLENRAFKTTGLGRLPARVPLVPTR
jgi:hypothetical protein